MLVNALLDRAARRSGLNRTGSEGTDLLQSLQDVLAEVLCEVGHLIDVVDCTLVTSDNIYSISSLVGMVPTGLRGVGVYKDQRFRELELVSYEELQYRGQSSVGTGGVAGLVAPLGVEDLMFDEKLRVGDVVRLFYVPPAATLTDTAMNITQIPVQFHQSVLLAGVIVASLDKDQRKSDVEFWGSRYEAGKLKMKKWAQEFMGQDTPMFEGASGSRIVRWPDERRR